MVYISIVLGDEFVCTLERYSEYRKLQALKSEAKFSLIAQQCHQKGRSVEKLLSLMSFGSTNLKSSLTAVNIDTLFLPLQQRHHELSFAMWGVFHTFADCILLYDWDLDCESLDPKSCAGVRTYQLRQFDRNPAKLTQAFDRSNRQYLPTLARSDQFLHVSSRIQLWCEGELD